MPQSPDQPYNLEQAQEEAAKLQEKIKSGEAKTYAAAEELVEKEKERKPFFFVYRENDLFKRYVPLIQDFLKEKGYPVDLKSFPAGTPTEEIKKWYLERQIDLQSKNILADNTSIASCGYDEKTFKNNLQPKIDLDELINQATVESISGDITFARQFRDKFWGKFWETRDNPEKRREVKEEYLSALGEIYKKILTSIPEEQRQKMEIVILKGLFRGNYIFPSLIDHEPFASKNFEELQKETDKFADKMKKWLNESGISQVTLFSTGAEIPMETIRKLIEGSAYIIFDRHTLTSDTSLTLEGVEDMRAFWGPNEKYSVLIKEKAALQTPVETFYNDAVKKLSIQADPKKMEEIIKRRLQEKLDKLEEAKNT
jgi:hypothetical protein